jgi:hypothetical protein
LLVAILVGFLVAVKYARSERVMNESVMSNLPSNFGFFVQSSRAVVVSEVGSQKRSAAKTGMMWNNTPERTKPAPTFEKATPDGPDVLQLLVRVHRYVAFKFSPPS